MIESAVSFFEGAPFAGQWSSRYKNLLRHLAEFTFGQRARLLDLGLDTVDSYRQRKLLRNLRKWQAHLQKLYEDGWAEIKFDSSGWEPSWVALKINLKPNMVLARSSELIFIYYYFRKKNPLGTNGARGLFTMARPYANTPGVQYNRIIVLDFQRDDFYQDDKFSIGEPWIIDRLKFIMSNYSLGYGVHEYLHPPPPAIDISENQAREIDLFGYYDKISDNISPNEQIELDFDNE